jgi:DNA-binding MarR family transcriptional regulator/GNAT superfamily N-acetyltransferase
MSSAEIAGAVRQFNRFYTRRIGVLRESLLDSEFSLTEARVLWELAHRAALTPTTLNLELGLDAGYLSRILRDFDRRGLVRRTLSPEDRRRRVLTLTGKGTRAFAALNRRSQNEIVAMLRGLSAREQERLLRSMEAIEGLLGGSGRRGDPFLIRTHRPGDLGWVVQRHAEVYAEEYGWDGMFEAMVAGIAAKFIRDFDPRREQCWIAERDGERAGAVLLTARSAHVAQLRLFLVERAARGHGIGKGLAEECIRFARVAGYRKVVLWTNSILVAARGIYEALGFRLVRQEPHHSFGCDLIGQFWELKLAGSRRKLSRPAPSSPAAS